jgi:xylulokinase
VAAEEGAAYGAAVLAGVGAGLWPSVDDACDAIVRSSGVTRPDSARVSAMSRQYEAYQRIYPALRSVFPDGPST